MSITNTIFNFKNAKKTTIIETDDFYKTEIGQKVLANPYYARIKEFVEHRGYAAKRGDNYFLVYYSNAKTSINKAKITASITRDYIIFPIKGDGETETFYNSEVSEVKADFSCERRHNDFDASFPYFSEVVKSGFDSSKIRYVNFTCRHLTTSAHTKYGFSKDNILFNKFIAPDSHWYECLTHDADRSEVLNGTADKCVLENTESDIWYLLKEKENNKISSLKKVKACIKKTSKKIDNDVKKLRTVKEKWLTIMEMHGRVRGY